MIALYFLSPIFRTMTRIGFTDARMEIKSLKTKELELLHEVLHKTHWDLEKSARLLKIPLSQVKRKIKEHAIEKPNTG